MSPQHLDRDALAFDAEAAADADPSAMPENEDAGVDFGDDTAHPLGAGFTTPSREARDEGDGTGEVVASPEAQTTQTGEEGTGGGGTSIGGAAQTEAVRGGSAASRGRSAGQRKPSGS